jgi:integrase
MQKLNTLRIKNIKEPGRYGDGGGLWLQVRDADHRSWIFRYTLDGRARWMGLGPAADITLAEARDAAREARRKLLEGIDPLDHREHEKASRREKADVLTFQQTAERYIKAREAGWKNEKHAAQWGATLAAYAYPKFGPVRVSAVTVGHVMEALEPIWRDKPETASRVRGRIENVLDYARARGWREGENPARWKGHLQNLLPSRAKVMAVEHHAALPWKAVGAFMVGLRGQEGIGAQALQFAILTAARTGEVIGATWGEIDLQEKIWTIPASRMKAGKEHRVPLSGPALAILKEMGKAGAEPGAFVFPGGKADKPLSNMTMAAVLKRMERTDLTVHGFRSTFRDWAGEATAYPREVAEAALAHTIKDKAEAAYRRGDALEKRARLMAEWATFCGRVMPAAGEVVQLHREHA